MVRPQSNPGPQSNLHELTAPVTKHGVLEPILFRSDEQGGLYVVAGERRFAAAQNAGLTAIPAIFVEGNHAEISLAETSTISEILSLNKLPQEVRDECRSDPAISKNILIEIAKSKQQRGMLSLYKKYKAQKLSKEQIKTEARRDRKTKAEQTVNILGTMQTKISAVTLDDLTPRIETR